MINEKIQARINALPDNQKEKLKGCTSKRELMDRIAESDMELGDEELEAVAGGTCCTDCTRYDYDAGYEFPEDCAYECRAFYRN